MAHYRRVLPRDLFNESSLTKCLGRLWILIEDGSWHVARFEQEDVDSFGIEQDPSSGSIYSSTITLSVKGRTCRLERPLNSRDPWPLLLHFGDEDPGFEAIRVFDAEGNLSEDMAELIRR